MKRFTGWILTVAGGAAAAWGVVSVMTGSSQSRLDVTPDLSVDSLTTGLAGLAVLTIGLIWSRDCPPAGGFWKGFESESLPVDKSGCYASSSERAGNRFAPRAPTR